jgi:HSP20 family molecular chaperone IbpA
VSDDIDDMFDEIKKHFRFNSDMFDLDFFIFPESNFNSKLEPETERKAFKVSFHYESGMDKPDIKIEGDFDEKKLRDYLKKHNIEPDSRIDTFFKPQLNKALDAGELTLEPMSHKKDSRVMEPYTEINDFDEFTEIIFEVPGMEKDDIILGFNEKDKKITISAESKKRKYFKHIEIPKNCLMDDYSLEVQNGIGILKFKKNRT